MTPPTPRRDQRAQDSSPAAPHAAPTTPAKPANFIPALQGQVPAAAGVIDRRVWPVDRRTLNDKGQPTQGNGGLERRRGPGRRLSDFTRSAEEGEMNQEQFMFLMAIEQFKKANAKTFPTWTDVLEVIRLLGYRKTMPTEFKLNNAEDWREPGDAPAGVRPERWAQREAIDRARKGEAA